MTPEITIRSFSNDQYTLDKVFYANFYHLRGFKKDDPNRPVVVDVGAHCGYFSFSALSLGAKKVFAFEPFSDNYRMLVKNIALNPIAPVETYQFGVYPTNTELLLDIPTFQKTHYDFANIEVNGKSERKCYAKCFTLNEILDNIVKVPVGLLKLNIGYAEGEILKASTLSQVANLCGEVSMSPESVDSFKEMLTAKGYAEVLTFTVPEQENRFMFVASRGKCTDMFVNLG